MSSNIGCDQISKQIVRQRIAYNEHISFIKGYFILTKIENTGAFLSVGDSLPSPIKILLLSILPLAVLVLAFIYVLTKKNLSDITVLGICFIIGGGIGNVYDRLIHGSVTDFLHIDFVVFKTGIFNLADVSIMLGIFMILLEVYFKSDRSNVNVADEEDD